MKSNEKNIHPAGSLGPGSRRHSNRHERHCQGNQIRLAVSRRAYEDIDLIDRPRPMRARGFLPAEVV